jgi:uncharacterized DUF497 family protein
MPTEPEIQFDWDEQNERHLRRHGVVPEEFEEAFLNDPELMRVEEEKGEERSYAYGPTKNWRMLVLIYTDRGRLVRPITAWDAPKSLVEEWFRIRRLES